jgi:UrcA family protein
MRSIAGLTAKAWLPILAASLVAPACAIAAPPDDLGAGAAHAAAARAVRSTTPPGEPRSIRIAYHDLDIATPQGIAALYVRIRQAAVDVCDAARPLTGTRMIRPETEACVRRSIVATVQQIGVPGLAALDAEQQVLGQEAAARPSCEAPVRAKIII